MNILEINKFYYLRRGAERHLLDVINLFESRGDKVAVFAMRHPNNLPSEWERFFPSYVGYNRDDSTLYQRIVGTGRMFWSFEARRNIKRLLKEFRPDIVHLHNIYHQLSPSLLKPLKQSGVKIVMTVHDYHLISPDKDCYYEEVGRRYWKFLFVKKYGLFKRTLLILKMYWERWIDAYESVDTYIAPSLFVKNTLIRGGLDEKKIVVIPHFIAKEKSAVGTDEHLGKEKYALYFGSLSKEKGVDELVRMFDSLERPLIIAGSCEPGFILPESRFVTFVGKQSREKLEELIAASSCVVSGSTLPETFGLVALEAFSFGKPFFGLRSGAYTELVRNGENGFLADDFERLKGIVHDFFKGDTAFDEIKIQNDAYEKFSREEYCRLFFALR